MNFIKFNVPNSLFINDLNNKKLFLNINTAFKLSDILTDFEFVDYDANYYNLLIEYKMYFARILMAVCLNDKFLIDNLMRLLTEKLYRILTGINHPARGEKRIRSESRSRMSEDLDKILNANNKARIDKLYNDLSELIHHTKSTPADLYDIRKMFSTNLNISDQVINITEILTDVFMDEVFIKLCRSDVGICGTNFLINIENNLIPSRVNQIRTDMNL